MRSTCTQASTAVACDKVDKAAALGKGNFAHRPGAICRVLGECDASLAADLTCSLTVASKSGKLSECTVEGVDTGSNVEGISSSGV